MGAYGYPRATGDIDIWVEPTVDNAVKVFTALKEFGAPLKDLTQETFAKKGIIFQIGLPPRRIDILTEIDGVEFSKALNKRNDIVIDSLKIPFLSLKDLIVNKKATGRDKDKVDVKFLMKKKLK